jgi:hypothetical protein
MPHFLFFRKGVRKTGTGFMVAENHALPIYSRAAECLLSWVLHLGGFFGSMVEL